MFDGFVLRVLTRFQSGFRVWLDFKIADSRGKKLKLDWDSKGWGITHQDEKHDILWIFLKILQWSNSDVILEKFSKFTFDLWFGFKNTYRAVSISIKIPIEYTVLKSNHTRKPDRYRVRTLGTKPSNIACVKNLLFVY